MKKLILILTIALCVAGCSGGETMTAEQAKNLPIEHQFIIVDSGTMVPSEDPRVGRARDLLARASDEYDLAITDIVDMTYYGAKTTRKEGVNVSAMEVLEAVALVHIDGISGKDRFAEVTAMYLTLRKAGQPHAESMMGLKGILKLVSGQN